ncbi:MAG: UDP-3-O-(3-hydroxymyristoyl)glucosamine N-acyltransferase [Calditrichaceae bacterium]
MTLKEIADHLKGELNGPADLQISSPAKIEEAKSGQITFLSNTKYLKHLSTTEASAIVVDNSVEDVQIPHIRVKNAYFAFVLVLKLFEDQNISIFEGVSDKAFISSSAKIDSTVKIAPFVFIGPDVTIGKNTTIYPNAVILQNVTVGNDCIIYPGATIRENCIIGDRVILHNGAVIGSDGFGFAPYNNAYIKIPQLGRVVIEDDVEIGANTTIDRATLGSTLIRKGTKLDNLIMIAHNVVVGENTVMASQSGVAGSSEVGSNVTVAGQVGISGHIKIADGVILGAKSGVSKDIKEKGVMWGSPVNPVMKQKRIEACIRHLPDTEKKVKSLEKEIENLKKELVKQKNRSVNGEETENT